MTVATWFHCPSPPVLCMFSLLVSSTFLSREQREQRTVRLMTSASNALCLPLYVYLLLLCESHTAALGRAALVKESGAHIFWTVCSPAVLSFISTFAYLSQLSTQKVKVTSFKPTGRKSVRWRSFSAVAQVVNNNKCACRCWYMHASAVSVHLSALVSAYVSVCRTTRMCNYKGETISPFFFLSPVGAHS